MGMQHDASDPHVADSGKLPTRVRSSESSPTPSSLPVLVAKAEALLKEMEQWLRENGDEAFWRHNRLIQGQCEWCGHEAHHSTTGACDFTFRGPVRMRVQLVRDLLAQHARDQQEKAEAFRAGWATGYQECAEGGSLTHTPDGRPLEETAALERWLFVEAASQRRPVDGE